MSSQSQIGGVQQEWLDLKALTTQYACISERTLREWIHRPTDPLPAVRIGTKLLIRRSIFDRWLEAHPVKSVDVSSIVEEMVAGIIGTN
jgi:excisionase family DNA binding protein